MATLTKFYSFVEEIAEGGHNLGSDTLKVALSNTSPTAATDTVFLVGSLHPAPSAANGYTAGGHTSAQESSAQTGGTYKLCLTDVEITATAGGIGPFRYIILYNSSKSDKLIGFYDYGSSITLNSGEKLTVNFDGANGVLTLA